MLTLSPPSLRYITNILLLLLATCAAVYGVTYAYLLHHIANFVAAWLVLVHCTDLSFSGLSQMLGGDVKSVGGGDTKKRPWLASYSPFNIEQKREE